MSDRVTKMPGIVTATLPAAGAGAGSTVAGRAESSASAVTCPAVNRPPADCTEHQIDSGGIARHYLMYLPAIAADGHRLPVIFDFHGSGSDPREQMQVSGMADAAERNGFLLLMPMAAIEMPADGFTWNVPPAAGLPDDVRFALDVLEHASRRVSIDSKRVYVTGFSGGARLASEIACAAPGRIAAVGAVGGLRSPPARPHRAVPVIAFHGTGDPINPYAGDGADYWTYGIDSAVHAWVDHNGCAAEPEVSRVSESVDRLHFRACRRGADVVLYRIEGGGHTWPGSNYPFPAERFGRVEQGLDATGVMLDFFADREAPATAVANGSDRQ